MNFVYTKSDKYYSQSSVKLITGTLDMHINTAGQLNNKTYRTTNCK